MAGVVKCWYDYEILRSFPVKSVMMIYSIDGNNRDGVDSANIDNGGEDVNRTGVEITEMGQ